MQLPEFLATPLGIHIKKAIGLFHVHGHIKECFARYAPTFIKGSGMLAGEVIETLWSPLNHTASSARTMTWYHRQEYLDSHMGDSNWKKMIGMCMWDHSSYLRLYYSLLVASTLLKRWKTAVVQEKESRMYFKELCASVGPEKTEEWTKLEEQMQLEREENIAVMDQLDVKERQGLWHWLLRYIVTKYLGTFIELTKADMTTLWIRKEFETQSNLLPGSAQWIALGVHISEQQSVQ